MFRRIMRVVLSKTFLVALLALLQIAFFVTLVYWFANFGAVAYTLLTITSMLILMAVLDKDDLNPAYKLLWMLVIVLMPLFGAFFYVLWGHRHVPRRKRFAMRQIQKYYDDAHSNNPELLESLNEEDRRMGQCAQYLATFASAPLYIAEQVEYYPLGQDFYPRYLDALRGAKKYIFMEYYIYEEGQMLDEIVAILREKAAAGVDVRVIWDGFGSLFTLPPGYDKLLRSYGIKCHPFFPLAPTIRLSDYGMLNHRDHRKITVVDGEIGFSGGLNIADEYINRKVRFGLWKDTSFMLRGAPVYSLTTIFLRIWDVASGTTSDLRTLQSPPEPQTVPCLECGYVQPYGDSPLDSENVSENAYLNVIRHASRYVWISTPYLILDHEMITNLTLAAKSGVDVRILTPGIPDKRLVFMVTQSYYPVLLEGGVRIFEYTPGFNHAKMYVSDDKVAIIGSANMDYRSLYLHFENCAAFYGGEMIYEVKKDMEDCFYQAREITLENIKKLSPLRRITQMVLKFFAPMM